MLELQADLLALDAEFQAPGATMSQPVWIAKRKEINERLDAEKRAAEVEAARTAARSPVLRRAGGTAQRKPPYRMSDADRAQRREFKGKIKDALEAGDVEGARSLMLDERHMTLMIARAREKASEFTTHENLVMVYVFHEQQQLVAALDRARNRELKERLEETTARVEALEARSTAVSYRGVWSPQERYQRGAFATWDGSIWYCSRDGVSEPPSYKHNGESPWVLACKKGRDAKDAR